MTTTPLVDALENEFAKWGTISPKESALLCLAVLDKCAIEQPQTVTQTNGRGERSEQPAGIRRVVYLDQ